MKKRTGDKPYDDYWIYGPILNSTECRRVIVLIPKSKGQKRTSTSYARYMMATKLQRHLSDSEHVDHVDGDTLNDSMENLQILTPEENNRKHRRKASIHRRMLKLRCPECYKTFVRRRNQTHLVKNGKLTACSRRCSGKIRRKLQLGVVVDLSKNVISEYLERSI